MLNNIIQPEKINFNKKLNNTIKQLLSDSATPDSRLITLTEIYEIMKENSEKYDDKIIMAMKSLFNFNELDKCELHRIILEIKISLPICTVRNKFSSLTKEYLSEIDRALTFCEKLIPNHQPLDTREAIRIKPQIRASIQKNIDSLEILNKGLLSYQSSSQRKVPQENRVAEEEGVNSSRVALAKKLVEKSQCNTLSVKQRVIDIQADLENNKENFGKSTSTLLEKCWNVLNRIGNAIKGVYRCQDEAARTAYFKKAANPEISADKEKLTFRFFQGAQVVGIRSGNDAHCQLKP